MYSWGYLVQATLAKMDIEDSNEQLASNESLFNRFKSYANEAMTSICSAIKPKHTYAQFEVIQGLDSSTLPDANSVKLGTTLKLIPTNKSYICTATVYGTNEWTELAGIYYAVGESVPMPSDYISFGDDVNFDESGKELHDEDFHFYGYNHIIFLRTGRFSISYNSRWIDFRDVELDDELEVPYDILDAIPSYIASQCFKIDDMYRSQVFRNEYEMAIARIDDTNYKNTKTFTIGGDW